MTPFIARLSNFGLKKGFDFVEERRNFIRKKCGSFNLGWKKYGFIYSI